MLVIVNCVTHNWAIVAKANKGELFFKILLVISSGYDEFSGNLNVRESLVLSVI
jgi:hypothetical protein